MPPTLASRSKADPPCLRFQRRSKSFFVRLPSRFGGGTAWFGSDAEAAAQRYADWAATTWAPLVAQETAAELTALTRPSAGLIRSTNAEHRLGMRMHSATVKTVREVAELVWQLKDSEGISAAGRQNWRARLKPFLDRFGSRPIDSLTPGDLIGFKASLTTKSVNYQRDCLSYTRAFLRLAWELGEIATPYRIKVVLANPRRGLPTVKGLPIDRAAAVLKAVFDLDPNTARILYLGFLTCARPSDLMRTVYQQGEWQGDWIIHVAAKTTAKTGCLRPMILSPVALTTLLAITPKYKTYLGLRHQVWTLGRRLRRDRGDDFIRLLTGKADLSPHALIRHTPYRALCEQGVSLDLRRQLMGRGASAVDRAYHPTEDFAEARKAAEVLARLIPPSVVGVG